MESTVVSLFSDYKHGKRFKSYRQRTADMTKNKTMPSLSRSKPREPLPTADSFHQVEVSKRLHCTTTPPPSLQSQSLPRIRLHGNHTRQRHHHGNGYSHDFQERNDKLFMSSTQYRTTQSLPSLSQSKMSGKSSKSLDTKDPQKCSTFDLFKTSRLGRRTASHRQNFAWDFSPRDDVALERNDNCFPTLDQSDTASTRPVHLYMSVEMMDKLLEKRKGLRSDAALNALIGLPPNTMKSSNNKTKKEKPIVKAVRLKLQEDKVQEITPSILKETTSEASKSEETKLEEPKSEEPKSEKPKSGEPKSDKDVEYNTFNNLQEDDMEFEDEEEAELGGLGEEDGDEEFDAAEDDEEYEEEELDEVSNNSDDDVNGNFSEQGREGDETPDTAEEMDEDCDEEEEDAGEGVDEQENAISDDDGDEDLAGQDKEEEEDAEGEVDSDQDDEPVEDGGEGGELSDEDKDGQNEASEDELISDDDGGD